MLFQGRKTNGKLEFRGWDKDKYKVFLEGFKEGTWFNIKITKAQKPKTTEQLGLYYAVFLPVINQELINKGYTMMVCGVKVPIDKKQTDKVIKFFCARQDEDGNIVLHDAENFPDRPIVDKKNMGKDHIGQFLNNVSLWAVDYLGCQMLESWRN